MVSMTLAISEELKKEMDKHPETNWSEVARQAIKDWLEKDSILEKMDEILKNSTMTMEDAIELGRKVKKGAAKKILAEMRKRETRR